VYDATDGWTIIDGDVGGGGGAVEVVVVIETESWGGGLDWCCGSNIDRVGSRSRGRGLSTLERKPRHGALRLCHAPGGMHQPMGYRPGR
jgi:hypothetical protein